MSEDAGPGLFEAERSAWIKGRKWPLSKYAAARRADQLARRARKLSRDQAGLDDISMQEAETKGTYARLTQKGGDHGAEFVGLVFYVLVYCIVLPIFVGLAWAIGTLTYRAWASAASTRRPLIAPYIITAAVAGAVFYFGRGLGLDLLAIHGIAGLLETATGGLIAPAVLSRWYAAGIMSLLEIQVVLGFLYGGWLVYAWGWTAPAVRRGHRAGIDNAWVQPEKAGARKPAKLTKEERITKIISGGGNTAA